MGLRVGVHWLTDESCGSGTGWTAYSSRAHDRKRKPAAPFIQPTHEPTIRSARFFMSAGADGSLFLYETRSQQHLTRAPPSYAEQPAVTKVSACCMKTVVLQPRLQPRLCRCLRCCTVPLRTASVPWHQAACWACNRRVIVLPGHAVPQAQYVRRDADAYDEPGEPTELEVGRKHAGPAIKIKVRYFCGLFLSLRVHVRLLQALRVNALGERLRESWWV